MYYEVKIPTLLADVALAHPYYVGKSGIKLGQIQPNGLGEDNMTDGQTDGWTDLLAIHSSLKSGDNTS